MNRRSFYAGILAVILTGGCDARHGATQSSIGPPGNTVDLGAVFAPETKEITHTFQVKNSTARPVIVEDLEYSCACTEAEIGRRQLPPGATTTLRMRINVAASHTEKSVVCAVRTDHPDFPLWNYAIKYTSYPRSIIAPNRIELETASTTSTEKPSRPSGSGRLEIYSGHPNDPIPKPGIIDAPPGLVVEVGDNPEVSRLGNGLTRYSFLLAVSVADMSSGSFVRPLRIGVEGGPAATTVVSWRHVGPLECSPPRVHFGVVELSDTENPPTRKVIIRSPSGRPFRLARLDRESSVVIRKLGGRAPVHVLDIGMEVPADSASPALSGVIQLEADLTESGTAKLDIPWSAFVARPGMDPGTEADHQHQSPLSTQGD
ncbi:hypothetical protein BH23PLA1_BH23PLA1_33450 [soil metagenome]